MLARTRPINFNKNLNSANIKTVATHTCTKIATVPNLNNQIAWFITGIVQSDGFFTFSILRDKERTKIQKLKIVFGVEMVKESLPLLLKIQEYFGCGTIDIPLNRNSVLFRIDSIQELWHKVVPHFLNYPLIDSKLNSFYKFLQVLIIIYPYYNKSKNKLILAWRQPKLL